MTSINPAWGAFSQAEQNQMMQALGQDSLPAPSELSPEQIQKLNTSMGFNVGIVVLNHERELKTEGTRSSDKPFLDAPEVGDASQLTLMLMALKSKLGDIQVTTAKEGVQNQKQRLEAASNEHMGKIKEALGKMKTADGWSLAGKIAGWIGASLGIIASLAGTAIAVGAALFTGGSTLAALALTLPALAVSCAGMGLMISDATGLTEKVMDFVADNSWTLPLMFGLVGGVIWALDMAGVMDEDSIKIATQVLVAVDMLVLSVATGILSMGAGGVGGASNAVASLFNLGAKGTETLSKTIDVTAKLTQIGGQVMNMLMQFGSGGLAIGSAISSYDATSARADSKEFQAWMAKLQSQMDDEQESLQKAIEALNNDMMVCTDILEGIAKNKTMAIGRMGAS
jgi:hypothetical protein